MEAGQYDLSGSGGAGHSGGLRRKKQHHHDCLDGHDLYEPADGVHFGAPERYSYHMLRESGEFVINLATESMAYATDYCGVRSGRNVDKWKETGLTPVPAQTVKAPVIAESPVAIECRVTEVKELGSHHMFLAEVTGVSVDEQWLNERGSLELAKAEPIVYSHGGYYGLSELLGTFGWSVKKKKRCQR